MSSYDVGPDHRLTVPGLLRQLHDTAQAHAAAFGFGYRGLLERRQAWALASIDLSLDREPPLGEADFEAATAVHQAAGPVVLRDYRATDAEGRIFARGQSMWALIDLDTRRTAKPSDDLRDVLRAIATDELGRGRLRRLRDAGGLPAHERRVVHLHDCDFNGHLNNVVTAGWLLDAVAGAGGRRALPAIGALRLTYHRELFRGEVGLVGLASDGTATRVEVRREDGALVANAELTPRGE